MRSAGRADMIRSIFCLTVLLVGIIYGLGVMG